MSNQDDADPFQNLPPAVPPVPMTREEWMRRYAARMVTIGGMGRDVADEAAKAAADSAEDDEWLDPEESADEEMSYWTDDEGGS